MMTSSTARLRPAAAAMRLTTPCARPSGCFPSSSPRPWPAPGLPAPRRHRRRRSARPAPASGTAGFSRCPGGTFSSISPASSRLARACGRCTFRSAPRSRSRKPSGPCRPSSTSGCAVDREPRQRLPGRPVAMSPASARRRPAKPSTPRRRSARSCAANASALQADHPVIAHPALVVVHRAGNPRRRDLAPRGSSRRQARDAGAGVGVSVDALESRRDIPRR